MKNFRCCTNQGRGFHHKHNKGHKKHHGGDDKQLLFELFKHFLRTRLQEQEQESQQQECSQSENHCQETAEVTEVVDCGDKEQGCELEKGPKKHCHKFGHFKRGHKHWGKHHHKHHQRNHGAHHHHCHGKHHKC